MKVRKGVKVVKKRNIYKEAKKLRKTIQKPVLQPFAGFLSKVFLRERAENEVERR